MRAAHWFQWCPCSKQRMYFPFTSSKADGESCAGAWGYCYCYLFHLRFSIYCCFCVFHYPRDRHEQLRSKIKPGPRFFPSMWKGASTSVLRSPSLCYGDALTVKNSYFFHFIVGGEGHDYLVVDVCYRLQRNLTKRALQQVCQFDQSISWVLLPSPVLQHQRPPTT